MSQINEEYKEAFTDSLLFQQAQMKEEKHWPVFLMGNSLQSLIRAYQTSGGHLIDIKPMQYKSFELKLVEETENTFLFSSLSP